MSVDDYDQPFKVSEDEDGIEGGIHFNPSDSGKTETAWINLVDDETESIRARASVIVHKQPIPHTTHEQRVFSDEDVTVELLDADEDADVPDALIESLLNDTDVVEKLRSICSEEDQRDSEN